MVLISNKDQHLDFSHKHHLNILEITIYGYMPYIQWKHNKMHREIGHVNWPLFLVCGLKFKTFDNFIWTQMVLLSDKDQGLDFSN